MRQYNAREAGLVFLTINNGFSSCEELVDLVGGLDKYNDLFFLQTAYYNKYAQELQLTQEPLDCTSLGAKSDNTNTSGFGLSEKQFSRILHLLYPNVEDGKVKTEEGDRIKAELGIKDDIWGIELSMSFPNTITCGKEA